MSMTPRSKSKTVIMNSIEDNGKDEDHLMNHVRELKNAQKYSSKFIRHCEINWTYGSHFAFAKLSTSVIWVLHLQYTLIQNQEDMQTYLKSFQILYDSEW